jgi:hypothetical protein
MIDTYNLIKRDGTRQEVPFFIVDGCKCISPHIFFYEFGEHDDAGVLRADIQPIIFEPLIDLFEKLRATVNRPIKINSGYRTIEKQARLYEQDIRANGGNPSGKVAAPSHAPHTYGAAMDLAIPYPYKAGDFATLIRKVSLDLKFPMARTGWKAYGGAFVHMDLVPMMFKPYTNISNPCPEDWTPGRCW